MYGSFTSDEGEAVKKKTFHLFMFLLYRPLIVLDHPTPTHPKDKLFVI